MKKSVTAVSVIALIIGLNMAGSEATTNQLAVSLAGFALMVAGGLGLWWANRRRPGWRTFETIDRR